MDVKITGADQLADLGKAFKAADKSIKNEFTKELRTAGKPAGDAIRNAYGDSMPQRGGLAALLRASKIGVRTRSTGKNAGVRLDVRNKHDLPSIEDGVLRHKVFGNPKVWVKQSVPKGVGDAAFAKQQPAVQRRMLAAMDAVADKLMRSI